MMISIDTETQGLNTQRFIMGVIIDEKGKAHHYDERVKMLAKIRDLAQYCRTRKKTLLIYAHHMLYDYHVLHYEEPKKDHIIYSHDPFIADQRDDTGRIYAKWLSTTSLWHGPLETMGEGLGMPKGKTPEWLTEDAGHEPTFQERHEAHTYMEQDARIVHAYMNDLKERLSKEHIKPRWILTGAQIGIQRLLAAMRNAPNVEAFYADKYKQRFYYTKEPERIHEALRGGRVEALQLGTHKNTTNIDLNSHYPDMLRKIRMPDLRTQTIHKEPLKRGFTVNDIIQHIGISHALVRIDTELRYGVLPVREEEDNTIYPRAKGSILIGTWTHHELQAAQQRGWTILDINWSHTWQETTNPFNDMVQHHYQLKQNATTGAEKGFHKILLNGGIGKFAQRRETYTYVWKNIEEEYAMLKAGYEAVESSGTERLYRKYEGTTYPDYYAPIINALITAHARITLLEAMERIKGNNVYYVDTDGIIGDTKAIANAKFKYGQDLGMWKSVLTDETLDVKGKKAYKHGINIKLSGVGKKWVTDAGWNDGNITYKRMRTERSTNDPTLIGTFEQHTINLRDVQKNAQLHEQHTTTEKIHVDEKNMDSPYLRGTPLWTQ